MKKAVPYLLLAVLFVGAGWYALTKKPDVVDEVVTEQAPTAVLPEAVPADDNTATQPYPFILGEAELQQEPETAIEPLPPLQESDPQVDESLAGIFGSDVVEQYLVKDQVISRMVSMVDSLTSRQVPPLVNPIKPAAGEMIVDVDGEQLVLSPDNYARYDDYVQELQNTDSADLLNLYQRYQPLFQQAWQANGGEGPFTQRLIEVIDELLATPDVPQPVYLAKPEAVYVFEDPALEAMSAGQKTLVRMGSANAVIVKQKLAEIKAGLTAE